VEVAATDSQWLNAVVLIGVPFTCTTASLGTPLLPHAERPAVTKKTAPSAEMERRVLDTTGGTLAENA
jgi:hypothetical protein